MTISVSTERLSSSIPASACFMRFLPSNWKGLVTTPTLSEPTSRAIRPITGAPPVPVPPPMPAVMKTMSAPARSSRMWSTFSSAAARPTSGFAPAPSPFSPSCSFCLAWLFFNACASVFATRNSTPCRFAAIIVLTALPPPPPTPTTLMRAPNPSPPTNSIMTSSFHPADRLRNRMRENRFCVYTSSLNQPAIRLRMRSRR
jgi:hypothetical protein